MSYQKIGNLDLSVNLPAKELLHVQFKVMMQQKILSGVYERGNKLPPISKLVKENLVSKVTIKRAYWNLQKEGFIEQKDGFGYFVNNTFPTNSN